MSGTIHQHDVDHLVHDRIGDLYSTAAEVRSSRRPASDRAGLVTRTRATIGRRLISLGSAVAGQQA
jgi:hypothetical protein